MRLLSSEGQTDRILTTWDNGRGEVRKMARCEANIAHHWVRMWFYSLRRASVRTANFWTKSSCKNRSSELHLNSRLVILIHSKFTYRVTVSLEPPSNKKFPGENGQVTPWVLDSARLNPSELGLQHRVGKVKSGRGATFQVPSRWVVFKLFTLP